ncbi:poly(A) RNA polymerase gld-2 homolog B-like isoform X2 [Acanthaster planci]|uniref:Poly(A) RNA polymerase gld-2 homolog B-like isoform X2 n=1 Tax=Acanthaster planci TaxID=133434 RepID=A0A8B7ZT30_ACAPL|nr:poly(A) RNA polymerase gld-2 homolog B-like isoform X2 [Acanthaster planci]
MHRNTATSANHDQWSTPPFDSRVLPAYQRLLTPASCSLNLYPYQTPPPQNGVSHPGLFLIDKGRKTIKITGRSPVTLNQQNQGGQVQPSVVRPTTAPSTSVRTARLGPRPPETPGAYNLLVQVLGDESKVQLPKRGPATAESRDQPKASSKGDAQVNGLAVSAESRLSAVSSLMATGSRNRKSFSASGDFEKAHGKPMSVRTYTEHPPGHLTAQRTQVDSHSGRNSSTSTATPSQIDQRIPHRDHSGLVNTPKTSTRSNSDSSRSSRKRTHDSHTTPELSPKPNTSNPTGKVLDKISDVIWQNYQHSKQNTQRLYKKENLRLELERIIQSKYQGSMLFLVGSSLNGFATNSSDTDLCLMVSNKELNQKYHAAYILNVLHKLLLERSNFVSEAQVIYAKVPILKFVCSRTYSGLDCDININNSTGIRNTHLLQTYSKIDWRVAPLVILIKQWASAQGINDASQGTLSSYSLVLMVISYLQDTLKHLQLAF